MADSEQTSAEPPKFDFEAYPPDTCFHERRSGKDRRDAQPSVPREIADRRKSKERRRRVDPTTFDKQYTDDELEFMNAMQRYKVRTGKSFPTYGEVLRVASELGYRQTAPAGPLPSGKGSE